MKLKLVAAAAALSALAPVHALTTAEIAAARAAGTLKEFYVSGASALRLSFGAAVQSRCAPASFDVFFNDAAGASHRAYSCNLGQAVGNLPAGTPVLVYKRDQGGSGQGVNPVALATPISHMIVGDTCVRTAEPQPATSIDQPTYTCGTTANTVSDAGISDVEPSIFQASANLPGTAPLTATQLGNLDVGPLAQGIFGIMVNKQAYLALQKAQGIVALDASAILDVPADQDSWTAATLATIPSLPTQFVRSFLTTGGLSGNNNTTAKRGWNIVIPTSVDAQSEQRKLHVCRRVEGSGTQAASNAFWAYNPCNAGTGALSPLNVAANPGQPAVAGTIAALNGTYVNEGSGAGNVEACMNSVDAVVGAYGLGWIGREANPRRLNAGGVEVGNYRYVKLDGVAPVRSEAQTGNYPAVYEATMQWNRSVVAPGSEKDSFLRALRDSIGSPAALAVVDSNTQQGVMSPPASYTGPWLSQVGVNAQFASRVGRASGNSCAPIRIVK